MAKRSKSTAKIIGLVLLVVGIGLALWGSQISGSVSSKLTKVISGSSPDKVMYLYIGGVACFVVGVYLQIKK